MDKFANVGKMMELMREKYNEKFKEEDPSVDFQEGFMMAVRLMEDTPAADVKEVVRCKDCKHGSVEPGVYGGLGVSCWLQNKGFFPDDFCSYGEKREEA